MSLGRAGVELTITARTAETLERTAEEIRKETGAKVTAVPGDISTETGRAAALAACPNPDILVNNCGGPPHGDFREWSVEDWQKALNANMLTPIMLIKATVDGMCARKFGRIVNITSGSVKSPIPNLGMSNGARAGLTAFCAGLARRAGQLFAHREQALLDLLTDLVLHRELRKRVLRPLQGALQPSFHVERLQDLDFLLHGQVGGVTGHVGHGARVGDPAEFGDACAFLCSASAGFIVGQNLLLDGGAFNSTMG